MREKKKIFLKYLIIACFISAANVLFCFNQTISYAVIAAEIIFLLYVLVMRNLAEYISYFMIFMCNCIEFSTFAGEETFYSLKNFRIFGINIGIIMLLPILVIGIMNMHPSSIKIKKSKFSFPQGLILLNLIALVVGLFLVFMNDNNIHSLGGIGGKFFNEFYSMSFLPLAFIIAFEIIPKRCPEKLFEIGLALQATLWANVFQMLVSLLGGLSGTYGYLSTLLNSILNFLIPLLILYPFFEDDVVFPKLTTIVGLLGSILAISFNANGKVILLFFICLAIYWWFSFTRGSAIVRMIMFIAMFAVIISLPVVIISLRSNPLFNAKFEEVERLIDIFNPNWLNNLNMSARVRVEEFRDIFIEYGKKPLLAIIGKGYLGSTLDHTGYFAAHIFTADGFVSEAEFIHGIYYHLHEGTTYLLMYGGIGLVFMIRFIVDAAKRILRNANAPLIIGAYWFILFYGYSFTLSTFGIIALLYGYAADNEAKKTRSEQNLNKRAGENHGIQ